MSNPDYSSSTYWFIPQGAVAEKAWSFEDADGGPADFTGWSARLQIRDGGQLLATLRNTGTRDGDITFDETGTVLASLPHTFTVGMSPTTSAVFDLELINGAGVVTRPVQGRVRIEGEVTTDD